MKYRKGGNRKKLQSVLPNKSIKSTVFLRVVSATRWQHFTCCGSLTSARTTDTAHADTQTHVFLSL